MTRHIAFLVLIFSICPLQAQANEPTGIFGVPSIDKLDPSKCISQLKQAGIGAVFVPPDRKTVEWFKNGGLNVYVCVNAFGGKWAWKRYPDSRPVKADGRLLGSEPDYKGHGGVCPTHPLWRHERLKQIEKLVKEFGGEGGIDGIWLDFVRYPGLWEVKEPEIPDTCYCTRCLEKFGQDTHIELPTGLMCSTAAQWVGENFPYEWMAWKKEQISSFVEEVRKILHGTSDKRRLKLGLFVVPWTKGERQNAVSYSLGQDAFQLSALVDVISPMLYHKMCEKTSSWIGHMTRYYKETAQCQVLPIVQSSECRPEELARALTCVGQAGGDGALVYSFREMKPDLWDSLKAFQRPANLITNPDFTVPQGDDLPEGWYTRQSQVVPPKTSTFLVKSSDALELRENSYGSRRVSNCVGTLAGNDREGIWYTRLPDCEPGVEYLFTGRLYRETWENGVYPTISLWGKKFYVNNQWLTKTFQPIRLYVVCPETPRDHTFRFITHSPGKCFWLTKPKLARYNSFKVSLMSSTEPSNFYEDFFPIGVFGADMDYLEQIKSLSLNTALISGCGEELERKVKKCHELGLKCVVSVPTDPDRLPVFLNRIAKYAFLRDLSFYVNDEPGIHSFPINTANDINRLIKERFPGVATCMAVVRPQVCRDYVEASDFFMMDQYPIPYMPMTWLSDCMDQTRKDVGPGRLASVIQAFGGRKWADMGWPRMPTWQEMDCLAFLSVVHGSRGIFFYTFKEMAKTEDGEKRLGRVVKRLNMLYPWLLEKNLGEAVSVEMVSAHRVDPKGRRAIHCCLKKKGDKFLLIAVNTIQTYVEAVIRLAESEDLGAGRTRECEEVFSGESYLVGKGGLRAKFKPYEAKAFLFNVNIPLSGGFVE